MEASLAATGMLDVLATSAVLFMMLSVLPSTSIVSYWARAALMGTLVLYKIFLPQQILKSFIFLNYSFFKLKNEVKVTH